MMATKRPDIQTQEQMWALLQKSNTAAINALKVLLKHHQEALNDGSWIILREDTKFLTSLAAQVNQNSLKGKFPLLSERQMICLRRALEVYQEDLWQIARERLRLLDDRPWEREDEYEPGAEEPINPEWQRFCNCGKWAQIQHAGEYYCLPCRRALEEPAYDLRELNEMVDPR